MQGKEAQITPGERIEMYGHPKDFVDKLHKSCSAVKATLESVPKLVDRLEQRKKIHEMAAQVMLDAKALDEQHKLLIERFKENKELLGVVSEGLAQNLEIAKANMALIKKN